MSSSLKWRTVVTGAVAAAAVTMTALTGNGVANAEAPPPDLSFQLPAGQMAIDGLNQLAPGAWDQAANAANAAGVDLSQVSTATIEIDGPTLTDQDVAAFTGAVSGTVETVEKYAPGTVETITENAPQVAETLGVAPTDPSANPVVQDVPGLTEAAATMTPGDSAVDMAKEVALATAITGIATTGGGVIGGATFTIVAAGVGFAAGCVGAGVPAAVVTTVAAPIVGPAACIAGGIPLAAAAAPVGLAVGTAVGSATGFIVGAGASAAVIAYNRQQAADAAAQESASKQQSPSLPKQADYELAR